MRILIAGAGGIGGYFGGRLMEAGCDATFLVRERRAAQLAGSGLAITSPHGDAHIASPPHVTADRIRSSYDLVIVTCKSYDLDSVMESMTPAVGPHTAILPLLNGMRHLDALSGRFGDDKVLGGHCMISAALDPAGHITHYSELALLTFGERGGATTARISDITRELQRGRFDVKVTTEIMQEMWEKWVFIASMGCIHSLMRAPIKDVAAAGAHDLVMRMYEETTAIAARNGHAPRAAALERARDILGDRDNLLLASMYRDVEAGNRTEAEHLVGDLIARGGGTVSDYSLLRIAYAHLSAYESRRLRENTAT